ncbi:MAG: type II secretion system protein [Elusimicrobiota bacterium]
MNKHNNSGFTLIELMIVIVVIAVLAAIAVPKYGEAMRNSSEGSTRANLGMIRKALSVYYSDMDGQYPSDMLSLLPVHMRKIPAAKLPGYHDDSKIVLHAAASDDAGGWLYDNVNNGTYGTVRVNCSHTDAKGSIWTSY